MADLPESPIPMTITVLYSCTLCGLKDVAVSVPARRSDDDVVKWIEGTAAYHLAADHERRSPHCRPKTFAEVKIPITGADWLGGPAIQ